MTNPFTPPHAPHAAAAAKASSKEPKAPKVKSARSVISEVAAEGAKGRVGKEQAARILTASGECRPRSRVQTLREAGRGQAQGRSQASLI